MVKPNGMREKINELISDHEVSDESIYVAYQFLSDLLIEFESQALGRLKRYGQAQQEMRSKILNAKRNLKI